VNALQAFFAMGGYASYVWPAYALFLLVLIADLMSPRLRRRRLLRELRVRLARQDMRQTRARAEQPDSPLPNPPAP
jgi:heme exporter protein D